MKSKQSKRTDSVICKITMSICFMTCVLLFAGCDKDDDGKKVGTIDDYAVSIGEIGQNDKGYITVELLGNLPGSIIIKNGNAYPHLGMRIVVDKKTIEMQTFSVESGKYTYGFSTQKNPEKIIVYSINDTNQTLTFNGKRKTVE